MNEQSNGTFRAFRIEMETIGGPPDDPQRVAMLVTSRTERVDRVELAFRSESRSTHSSP